MGQQAYKFVLRFAAFLPLFVRRSRRQRLSLDDFWAALLAVEEIVDAAAHEEDAAEAEKKFREIYLFP